MGKMDFAVNRLLQRRQIFADLINGSLYGGSQVIVPEELEHLPPRSGWIQEEMEEDSGGVSRKAPEESAKTGEHETVRGEAPRKHKSRRKALTRTGDIRMRAKTGAYSVLFAHETQAGVHYAMPVRTMLYDSLEYARQIQDLEKKHRGRGDITGGDEFLSGITGADRLIPVINTVLYLGDHWDGSRTLYEMLDLDWENPATQKLIPYLPDYHINLIPARQIPCPDNYKTCLQQIFHMLKYDKDKKKLYAYIQEHRAEIDRMDQVERDAALALLGEQKRVQRLMEKQKEEKEEVSMCQAITDLILDGEARGEAKGIAIGEAKGIELGKAEGSLIGQERMAKLILALIGDHREDLIALAAADAERRSSLFLEYNI